VQVPARQAAGRDEAATGRCKQVSWPQIKGTAAGLGAWLCSGDESGQGLRPPKGRTWGRRGHPPVVRVTGAHNTPISLAALIATKPGCRSRLICRTHLGQLAALIKTRLKPMQYRPGLIDGFLAKTGPGLAP